MAAIAETRGAGVHSETTFTLPKSQFDPTPFVQRAADLETLELLVPDVHCGGCVRKIEGALGDMSGVDSARVNLSTKKLHVSWRPGQLAPEDVVRKLETLGFDPTPFVPEAASNTAAGEERRLVICLGVAAFASMNVMLFSVSVWSGGELGEATRSLFYWLSALVAIPATLFAGTPFYRSALNALSHGRANMDVPISVGVLSALGISIYETFLGGAHVYFEAPVMLLFLLLTGRFLDYRLRDRARVAARDLLAMQSGTVLRLNGSNAEPVRFADIQVGDILRIGSAERLPVNCVVLEGESQVDSSLVTGESVPGFARRGDLLFAGVCNLGANLVVRAVATVNQSLIADLTRLIEAGEQRRARFVRLADKAAQVYVPVVHTLAIATLFGWLLVGDASLRWSLMTAVAVLIVTCPCALGLAVPAVQIVATGRLFRSKILVKSGDALERLAEVDTVVFDKTGTLTYGQPRLKNEQSITGHVLSAAAELARASRHPFSRAIALAAGPGPIAPSVVEKAGEGMEGLVQGEVARLGRGDFVGVDPSANTMSGSHLWFRLGNREPVAFCFEDRMRDDAAATIAALQARGLQVHLISGDQRAPTEHAASLMCIDTWSAQTKPQEKAERLEALRKAGRKVLMVGDGLNDAAALSQAHVSISFGNAAGASQTAADLILQGDNLGPIVEAIDVARKARTLVLQNFWLSALYNLVAVPFAIAGFVTPLLAAIAMSVSSLTVTLNALRLSPGRRQA